jgi:hypothetical protein
MKQPQSIVFLVDVDNTLMNNDRIQDDLKRHIERKFERVSGPLLAHSFFEGRLSGLTALFAMSKIYQPHLVAATSC